MAVLTLLPATLVIVTAQAAIADPVAAGGPGIVRPVGVVAVTIGLGGLVAGLLRRRRVTGARAAAVLDSRPAQAEPARTETAV